MGDAPLRVVVTGGGISGLAAAYALVRAGADVTLVERSADLGGKVRTEHIDGFLIERGPDSFLTLRPAVQLAHEVGLGAEVTPPCGPSGTFVWHGRGLVPMPEGLGFGIPTRIRPFLVSSLFSPLDKLRAALEVAVPADTTTGDTSIGAFLRRRFGDGVVDRLAGPLISAIYGAPVDELSLEAVMPRLREAVDRHGSLVRAGLAARASGGAPAGPQLVTLRRGMGTLVDALASRLGRADLRLGVRVRRIEHSGPRYVVHLSDRSTLEAAAVMLAVPAPIAARILAELAPAAADALTSIPYRSTTTVSLAYDARQLAGRPHGHGFVVPKGALPIAACTWSSSKWPGRAPEGYALLRATIRPELSLASEDDAVAEAAHTALVRVLRIEGRPAFAHVTRWDGAMPRYTVGHLERLALIAAALRPFPGIVLAGAAYRGTGVPECIAQGQAAAEAILGRISAAA